MVFLAVPIYASTAPPEATHTGLFRALLRLLTLLQFMDSIPM